MQAIYETKGRAREFSELAINLFSGCTHSCIYCYAPLSLHKTRDAFTNIGHPRITIQDILKSAKEWADKGETRRVLLCFTCDPYMPIEQETALTRKCIMTLHEVGLNVTILTKGGLRSTRDFDLFTSKDAYAVTLTIIGDNESLVWEKNAAPPSERFRALQMAHAKGIETWVSFEPVIYPSDTMEWANRIKGLVSHTKVGKLNYHEHSKTINWHRFGWDMKDLLDKLGIKYYFKKDLLKEMGTTPENFVQTWQG